MSELQPLRAKNLSLPKYGLPQLDWDEIEQALAADGKKPQDATLAEMDALWDEAKARE